MTFPSKILVVEDESIVALDIQTRLRQLGYIVPGFVGSAEEAIAKTAELHPDLILMDIKLKGKMDGIEAAQQIKNQFGIPSIYLTAFADEATLQRAKETNPLGYLVKPFNEQELSAAVRMAMSRLQIERQLKASEQKFRSIIEQATDGVFLINNQGIVIEWNPALANISGIAREEALGCPAWEVWHRLLPEYQKQILKAPYLKGRILETLQTGNLSDNWRISETTIQRPDGEHRILDSRIFLIEEDSGQRAACISRDVTEHKKYEEALRQAQRFESLGVLAGGMAHDFNNLLVVILGQSSLALTKLPPTHAAVSHIRKVVQATEESAKLAQQMLAISGRGQLEKQPIQLNQWIAEKFDSLKVLVPDHIELAWERTDDLLRIEADPGELQQVLTNLIVNAAEAIGDHDGVISMNTAVYNLTSAEIQSNRYIGAPLHEGPYVRVTIRDNGAGMDSETLGKVFDPFFSTKNLGRGLGLPAAAGIMRGHHGAIWVDSTIRHGTILSLLFPESEYISSLMDEQEGEGVSKDMMDPDPLTISCVLVIDDQETVCEAVEDILALEDIPVLSALTGQDGIAIYQERQNKIGLVLLDLSMPGMNGYETYQALVRINPAVKVIFSSGYDEKDILKDIPGGKLVGFLKKPYNLVRLIETVKQHMGL